MKKKNIFLLAAGYLLGGFISSKYTKNTPQELDEKLKDSKEKGEGEFKVFFEDFIETHKNLFESIQKDEFYKNAQKNMNNKKEKLLNIIDSYKDDGIKLLDELKIKGKDYIVEISDKLEKLYNEKKDEIEILKEKAPDKMIEIKEKLIASFEEVREKINKERK